MNENLSCFKKISLLILKDFKCQEGVSRTGFCIDALMALETCAFCELGLLISEFLGATPE